MDQTLVLKAPPPLDSIWLAYEQSAGLLTKQAPTDVTTSKRMYIKKRRDQKDELLAGRDKDLTKGLTITDLQIQHPDGSHNINIRKYEPAEDQGRLTVVYYHGGGLYVGDLDSEDLTCRRVCKGLGCTVFSCDYRQMPECSADDALSDAISSFRYVVENTQGKLALMGSSSGGQLAAQVSQDYVKDLSITEGCGRLCGVVLRAPVTCDPSSGGIHLPARFKDLHTSLTPEFFTSIINGPSCVDSEHRTFTEMPLESKELGRLPTHWIQLCTNDMFYSDGACYVAGLKEAGVEVKVDVVVGWPHTFWIDAPYLDRAVRAEKDMINGLAWLAGSV